MGTVQSPRETEMAWWVQRMWHLLILPVAWKLPELKHISKCLSLLWFWAPLCSSAVHPCKPGSLLCTLPRCFGSCLDWVMLAVGKEGERKYICPGVSAHVTLLIFCMVRTVSRWTCGMFCISRELHLLSLSSLWARLQWLSLTLRQRSSDLA